MTPLLPLHTHTQTHIQAQTQTQKQIQTQTDGTNESGTLLTEEEREAAPTDACLEHPTNALFTVSCTVSN